ncbi:MAG: PIN domain-containing protein [Ottowia sp.]|uniref:type II toxin-antitoxin system VapC family toxin n=1 Tax=Ottowia sp. TaxID=1898956 RepID=UPI0039E46AB0
MTLVDTNVLLDLFKRDPVWMPWSAQRLRLGRDQGLAINIVVYAELVGYPALDFDLDAFLSEQSIAVLDISRAAAREAALAFRGYRQRGGSRTGVLPDFFIGAQAQAEGRPLLTRDATRYRTYFPTIELVSP